MKKELLYITSVSVVKIECFNIICMKRESLYMNSGFVLEMNTYCCFYILQSDERRKTHLPSTHLYPGEVDA